MQSNRQLLLQWYECREPRRFWRLLGFWQNRPCPYSLWHVPMHAWKTALLYSPHLRLWVLLRFYQPQPLPARYKSHLEWDCDRYAVVAPRWFLQPSPLLPLPCERASHREPHRQWHRYSRPRFGVACSLPLVHAHWPQRQQLLGQVLRYRVCVLQTSGSNRP